MFNLREFQTESQYNEVKDNMPKPNVVHIVSPDKVLFNPQNITPISGNYVLVTRDYTTNYDFVASTKIQIDCMFKSYDNSTFPNESFAGNGFLVRKVNIGQNFGEKVWWRFFGAKNSNKYCNLYQDCITTYNNLNEHYRIEEHAQYYYTDQEYSFEIGNYYIKNLKTNNILVSGAPLSDESWVGTDKNRRLCLGGYNGNGTDSIWIKSLRVYEGNTLVRNWQATPMNNGGYLLDSITGHSMGFELNIK